jgi:glycolate dehydrogenase FAD-binding subunit
MKLMEPLKPGTPEELATILADASGQRKSVLLGGAFSKRRMSGDGQTADVTVSSTGLSRILDYEPADLTISAEAGMPFSALSKRIGEDGLMLPLDPPFFESATLGGVVATNTSGPRRRAFGTARDAVIGMKFVTVTGKLVETGGMVVKNAAGLEMGKLLIGSMGVLAAITSVNFRLAPRPPCTRTFVLSSDSLDQAVQLRDSLVRGVLQPLALDLLNPAAAQRVGLSNYALLVQAGGSESVVGRYSSELSVAETFEAEDEASLWERVREFAPAFLAAEPGGAVVRLSTTISGVGSVVAKLDVPVVARAGSGVVHAYFDDCGRACSWVNEAKNQGLRPVVEYVAESGCVDNRWPVTGTDFTMMEKIKQMFDPDGLLNRGRLYGRL